MRHAVVFGASSLIGAYLLPRLMQQGYRVTAVSRTPRPAADWLQQDISQQPFQFCGDEVAISLAPVWVFGGMLRQCQSAPARIIAFSSTSAVVKTTSADPSERATAQKLLFGEDAVTTFADRHDLSATIFRPTMVYGAGRDKNIAVIARFIDRYGFFPLLGQGTGLRMPVHAADLADAVLRCLASESRCGERYALTGAEAITYQEMVERVFLGLERRKLIVHVPATLARGAVRIARLLPRYAELTPAMIDRTAQDLVFDSSDATEDFGYSPRPFRPGREDLLQQG